jgi:hypothetical protein
MYIYIYIYTHTDTHTRAQICMNIEIHVLLRRRRGHERLLRGERAVCEAGVQRRRRAGVHREHMRQGVCASMSTWFCDAFTCDQAQVSSGHIYNHVQQSVGEQRQEPPVHMPTSQLQLLYSGICVYAYIRTNAHMGIHVQTDAALRTMEEVPSVVRQPHNALPKLVLLYAVMDVLGIRTVTYRYASVCMCTNLFHRFLWNSVCMRHLISCSSFDWWISACMRHLTLPGVAGQATATCRESWSPTICGRTPTVPETFVRAGGAVTLGGSL